MTAKENLLNVIRTTSSNTIAIMTGEERYAEIDKISAKAVELAKELPEKVIKAYTDDGIHFPLSFIARIFKDAKKAI